jgi:peptidoglycan/LPS O-acetylase OafA/YrhL
VYIFFALSGYLLYRPFLGRAVDLRANAIKPAARILPGYNIALVGLALLSLSAHHGLKHIHNIPIPRSY